MTFAALSFIKEIFREEKKYGNGIVKARKVKSRLKKKGVLVGALAQEHCTGGS